MGIPTHIGIIMDGNRRWARLHGCSAIEGHDRGAQTFVDVCDWCGHAGVPYLTVYAFSTENWNRGNEEIAHIFGLLERFFNAQIGHCIEEQIRVRVIGSRERLSPRTLAVIDDAQRRTESFTRLNVQIAVNYGGRDEIVRAVRSLADEVAAGRMRPEEITEETFAGFLDTAGIPDVDLLIRTGGSDNPRLSNFLPWQSVYSEMYFSDLLWPDFSKEEWDRALSYYDSIEHKHGR